MEEKYDLIILGSGQGGNPLATAFASKGKKVLLIEKDQVGGTCVNRGCTPTKTMVASAKAAHSAKICESLGIKASFQGVDIQKIIARKNEIVTSFRTSSQKRMEDMENLDLIFGSAHFVDPHTIAFENQTATAPLIVINTGAGPMIPKMKGLDEISYLDSTSIMEVQELPKHLIVIGSSYIALEFGQMFHRFGSKVTILARSERIITREDPDISDAMREVLEKEGLEFIFNAKVQEVKKGIEVVLEEGKSITGSHLLIATGRTPNTAELALEKAGVQTNEKGFISVNEKLQTSCPHIYAIGDVKGGPAFTHISYDDFRILQDNLLEGKDRSLKGRMVPYTVFTDPQLGRVGISEEEAKKAGIPHEALTMPMSYVARAIEIGETEGLMKAIIHKETRQILGCAILGVEGGELMSMLQIAMMGNLNAKSLHEAIFAHPTLAEGFNNLF
ncbi:MAG: putative pyridine nucleotide-disulfide oxidoreductase RclA [Chlamydiae bacterium]|nr:putative pyridine nucleotide-disulfide oxidoreductase RclA [Chlamydiota bacterium]